jgi:hypothetical protein
VPARLLWVPMHALVQAYSDLLIWATGIPYSLSSSHFRPTRSVRILYCNALSGIFRRTGSA